MWILSMIKSSLDGVSLAFTSWKNVTILLVMMTISTLSEQVDDSCSSTSDPPQGVDSAPWGNNYLINKLIAIGDD